MTSQKKRKSIQEFIDKWHGRGREDEDDRSFWIDLLELVLGLSERATDCIDFQKKVVVDGHTKRIDAYLPDTKVLIEQKSLGIALDKKGKQSGGLDLTPYEQAKRYNDNLPYNEKARWIITSNFAEIWVYDMNSRVPEPFKLQLGDLAKEAHQLDFLTDSARIEPLKHNLAVSLKAGDLVGELYDKLRLQYRDPDSPETLKALNKLCVRLVFCLYAEDAEIFGKRDQFHDYLAQYEPREIRHALERLFTVLNQPVSERDPYLEADDPVLAAFPYVNGGLFADDNLEIPPFTPELRELLLKNASDDFDWSAISPTIFGAVFESTLNQETRRSGGMHYTSVENIHKVIDPLFLNDLYEEFDQAKAAPIAGGARTKALRALKTKLGSLSFLDPACGSGNFLTETYLSLRRLENAILREDKRAAQGSFGFMREELIDVSIGQFYGIEINDFAVSVARTALWIAEAQMMQETEDIVESDLLEDFLPLKTEAHIVEGNALRIDWNDVVPREKLNYIMGNPPFVGYSLQSKAQKDDILSLYVDENGKPYRTAGKIDYVSGWYWKSAELMKGTEIRAALVSTNSITQGEQVASVWKPLYDRFGIHIDFAHRTFRWDSEANIKAHVHCVIVGFSIAENRKERRLYTDGIEQNPKNINAYLVGAPTIFIEGKTTPICPVPVLLNGGKPTEGGFLILSEEEKKDLLKQEPQAKEFIRPYMMGRDFINRKQRYCLWMVHANPVTLKKCPHVLERIEKVRAYRLHSPKVATQKKAERPMLFDEVRECSTDYVAIPKVSSERRQYVPMEYLKAEVIPGDKLFMIENSSLYHFGVLTSCTHMAWMRAVCGRLKSDYSYSNTIVYNNFPWPDVTEEQKERISKTAQGILDARAKYPDASLADLYDPLTMPPDLLKAHQANDQAVMAAYGFPKSMTEDEIVAALMKRYQALVSKG